MSDRHTRNLRKISRDIERIAEKAFRLLLTRIKAGQSPRAATRAILSNHFSKDYYPLLEKLFTQKLYGLLGQNDIIENYRIGNLTLSSKLYQNELAVASAVTIIVNRHAKGFQDARKLALDIFEGYNFKEDPLKVKKSLPKYLFEPIAKLQAKKLKTPALRAAYLKLIDTIEDGIGADELEKQLQIAFYERNRYFANRIAQTELHKGFTDRQAEKLSIDNDLDFVQVRLSSTHPRPDICDFHARLNKYGLGEGVYPKDQAPVPPFHPFCRCLLSPRYDIVSNTRYREALAAEQIFINQFDNRTGAEIMGSYSNRDRILSGQSMQSIVNKNKDPAHHLKFVGDFRRSAEDKAA